MSSSGADPARGPEPGATVGSGPGSAGQFTPFWGALCQADQQELRRVGVRRYFLAGTTILRQNERTDHVIVVLAGCVKVVCTSCDRYQTVLALRGPGELVGELADTDGGPRSATVTALTDVQALQVPAVRFRQFRHARPTVDRLVHRLISTRLRESDRSRAAVGGGTAVQRLARVLLVIGSRYGTQVDGGGIRIDLPLSQEDLAGLTFSSLRTVGRILAEWREAGWISTGRRSMLLLDPAALNAARSS